MWLIFLSGSIVIIFLRVQEINFVKFRSLQCVKKSKIKYVCDSFECLILLIKFWQNIIIFFGQKPTPTTLLD